MNPERIERLIGELEGSPALELVQAVMDLHAKGLDRMMEIASNQPGLLEKFGEDEIVGGMLLLHDLHPLDLETRVRRALANRGELLSIRDGVVRVRIHGGPAEEEALYAAAPDAAEIVIERGANFVPLSQLLAGSHA